MPRDVIRELESIFGDRLVTEEHILMLYSHDASSEPGERPLAIVYPMNVDEIVKLIHLAPEYGIKLIPTGSSSSLSGNTTVKLGNTVVVSLERMSRVLEVSNVDWFARVEPGVRIDELNFELANYGLQWPVDPASSRVATVGGAISNGSGGMRGAKYGPASYWVLGLEAVIGTGEVIRVGCRTVKCREGYDILHLFIGSEGTLGIITEATLRLAPLPEAFVGLMAEYEDINNLVNTVINIRKHKLWPMITEFVDDETAQELGLDRKHYLWVGIDVNVGSEERVLGTLRDVVLGNHGVVINEARAWGEFLKILEPRRALYSAQLKVAFRDYGNDAFVFIEDIAVPMSNLPNAVREIRELSGKYGIKVLMGGHIGDGNLHPAFWTSRRASESEFRKYLEFVEKIGEVGIKYGGTISAEHGIGTMKRNLLVNKYRSLNSEATLRLMSEVKRIFDPHNILNPGKIIPT
ncbi:FAD-binding oxidoreductase [Vulcanisaeta thermophila]|uniref:FAD-binding oxidoreductase n=1 Tax=Vulcanisaeta thermophila TaxID=867917 RepID=UPI000853D284|nr:FAD-linked oxidase C-terminal domain-containing protein [Vulcanisaeta thermophila]